MSLPDSAPVSLVLPPGAVRSGPLLLRMTRVGTYVRRNFEPLILSIQVVVDLAVVLIACLAAFKLYGQIDYFAASASEKALQLTTYRELFSITAAVCLLCFHRFGMYSPIKSLLNVEEFKAVAKSTVTAFLVVIAPVSYTHLTLPTICSV